MSETGVAPEGEKYLIITSMKNEGSYLLEWIAYHRVIGFTDFLVYTNDCEDGTELMLDRLEEMGVLTHQRNVVLRRGPQKSALKYAREHALPKSADWILVSDVDEFLNVKIGDGTVQELVAHMPDDADVIPVTWRLFSHGGVIDYEDRPVIEQFTDAERPLDAGGFPDRFVKSLFRKPADVDRFGTHGPVLDEPEKFLWRQPDGRALGPGDNLTRPVSAYAYEVAQFNHYAVCSVDNFLVKRDRGRVNHWRQVMGLDYWRRMCRGGEEDATIHRHLDAVKAETARLLEDDKLRDLFEKAVDWRKTRIAELRQRPEYAEMRKRILTLSEALDHHRTAGDASLADAMEAEDEAKEKKTSKAKAAPADEAPPSDASARLKALCKEMRGLIDHVEPFEAAEAAHGRLDEMERGLFGAVNR